MIFSGKYDTFISSVTASVENLPGFTSSLGGFSFSVVIASEMTNIGEVMNSRGEK